MPKQQTVPYYDFRKRIINPYQITQLQLLAEDWGMSISDICWRFITDGIKEEKKKRDKINSETEKRFLEIEEIKKYK